MIIKVSKKKIRQVFFALYMFFLIFAPPIIPKVSIAVTIVSVLILSLKYRHKWVDVLHKSKAFAWCVAMIAIAFYACIVILINISVFSEQVQMSNYLAIFNRYVLLTGEAVICSIFIICYLKKNAFTPDDYIEAIIKAGLIQVVCVGLSFFSTDIKNVFIELMKANTDSSLYTNNWYVTVRSYGFAATLVDLFGLGMGIIAGLSFFYGLYKSKKYIVYSIFIAVAGTMNARTTIVIYGIAVVLGLLSSMSIKKMKSLMFVVAISICVAILATNMLPYMKEVNSGTYNFVMEGIEEIRSLLIEGNAEGTFSVLFSDRFIQIPEPFQLIFGSGHTLLRASGYLNSDVGYINDLWFIGMVGIVFLYGFIVSLLLRTYRGCKENMYKMSLVMFGGAFFAFNFKGCSIGPNSGMLIILCTIFVLNYFITLDEKRLREKHYV